MLRPTILGCAAVTALLALGTAASSASPTPGQYYLALGDSIAYGVQPAKVEAGLPPSRFNTGYVDVVGAGLRTLAPSLRVVNYGCPGESTKTMIAGGCPSRAEGVTLHDSFRGPQLAAALAFLQAHKGKVNPITVSLGGNDLFEAVDACKGDLSCAQKRSPQMATRLGTILRRLQAAAPNAVIVVTGIWNFDVEHLKSTDPQDRLFRAYDAAIETAARGRAPFADTFAVFNPNASPAKEKARICSFTFACSHQDPHPTNAGYKAIARLVLGAGGFGQR